LLVHRADSGIKPQKLHQNTALHDRNDVENHRLLDGSGADFGIQNKLNACSGLHKASFYGLGDPIIVVRVKDGRNPRNKAGDCLSVVMRRAATVFTFIPGLSS
jgi:hypothetical protein